METTNSSAYTHSAAGTPARANTKYQDTVFCTLFSNEDAARDLFNAVEDMHYGPDTPVEITTLENVFYLGKNNDLGFTIDNKFVIMAEHQSTVNPNIPLRLLGYVTYTYERVIEQKKIYSKSRLPLPAPVFYVFYTGDENWTTKTLRISDSYAEKPLENSLELVVKIINLRYNKDNEILQRSKTLLGYSMLITKIKDNIAAGMEPKRAIDSAIRECIEEDYLTDFLKKHGEEVGNMKFYEFTQEEYEALIAEESFAEGRNEGLTEGRNEGLTEGRNEGISAFILDHLEDGTPCEVICRKLVKRFSLTEKDAAKYIAQASVSERK